MANIIAFSEHYPINIDPATLGRAGHQWQLHKSTRQLNKVIQTLQPNGGNVALLEFAYGFGNNYAGANISNLDVSLRTLQLRDKTCKVIVFADKQQMLHVDKLHELFEVHGELTLPFSISDLLETVKAVIE